MAHIFKLADGLCRGSPKCDTVTLMVILHTCQMATTLTQILLTLTKVSTTLIEKTSHLFNLSTHLHLSPKWWWWRCQGSMLELLQHIYESILQILLVVTEERRVVRLSEASHQGPETPEQRHRWSYAAAREGDWVSIGDTHRRWLYECKSAYRSLGLNYRRGYT